jgi:hypothetical protein
MQAMRWTPFALGGLLILGSTGAPVTPSQAQQAAAPRVDPWYEVIFPEKSFDFGTVARGSKLKHTFRIVNTTSEDVRIVDYRTKCGCTDVRLGAKTIPPGTQTTVEIALDTTRFDGPKASGIILVFDLPQYVQVDLNVNCFIRSTLTLNPGAVDFQNVPRGAGSTQVLNLTYSGPRRDWAVTRLTTISESIVAELRETSREPGSTTVQYQLSARLQPSAPAGYFRDEITLFTNDPDSPTIPISVTANVQPALTVAPGVLNLGRMRPGQSVEKTVLVRGAKPFKVTSAASEKPDLKATGSLGDAGPLHSLRVTFTAPSQPGPYHATLEIATDLGGEPPAKVTAFATVIP